MQMSAAILFLVLAIKQYSVGKKTMAPLMTIPFNKVGFLFQHLFRRLVISGAIVFFPIKSGANLSLNSVLGLHSACTSIRCLMMCVAG